MNYKKESALTNIPFVVSKIIIILKFTKTKTYVEIIQ